MPEEPHHITRAYNASISRRGLRPFLDTLISREDKEEVEFEGYSDSDESQNTEPPCAHPAKSQRINPVLLLCAIILIFTILIPFLIPSSAHSITALGYTSLPSKWTLSLSLDTTNHICNSRSLFSTYIPFPSDTASTGPHCAGKGTILLSYRQENSKGNGNKTTQGVLGLYNVCHLSRPWWRRQRNTISLPALRAADIDTRLVPIRLPPSSSSLSKPAEKAEKESELGLAVVLEEYGLGLAVEGNLELPIRVNPVAKNDGKISTLEGHELGEEVHFSALVPLE